MSSSQQQGGGGGGSVSDEGLLAVIGFVVVCVGSGSVAAMAMWDRVVGWLMDLHLVVAAADGPVVVLPKSAGAGLDVPRLAVIAAAVIAVIVCVVSSVRRRREGSL